MNQKKSIFKHWWFWLIIVVVLLSLIIGGTSDSTHQPETTNDGTTALQIRDNKLTLAEETTIERYFEVSADGEFTKDDLKFISEDENIATVSYKEISMKKYVYFTVAAHKAGTTYIYFENQDGTVVSNKIAITVTESTDKNETTSSTTDKTSETKTDKTSDKPASTSTKTASSNTGTTSDTSDNNTSQNSGSSSVTVPDNEETGEDLVWIPNKNKGKHHRKPDCRGMKDPIQVTREEAIAMGFEACKVCNP